MTETKLKGKVLPMISADATIWFEFGPTQAELNISRTGTHNKKLKLKTNDVVEVTIRKL